MQKTNPSWVEKNVSLIIKLLIGACISLLLADVIFHFSAEKHVHFDIERWPGFYAIVGFLSYVGLVLTAKQLRKLLKRPEDYYGEAPSSTVTQSGEEE